MSPHEWEGEWGRVGLHVLLVCATRWLAAPCLHGLGPLLSALLFPFFLFSTATTAGCWLAHLRTEPLLQCAVSGFEDLLREDHDAVLARRCAAPAVQRFCLATVPGRRHRLAEAGCCWA